LQRYSTELKKTNKQMKELDTGTAEAGVRVDDSKRSFAFALLFVQYDNVTSNSTFADYPLERSFERSMSRIKVNSDSITVSFSHQVWLS